MTNSDNWELMETERNPLAKTTDQGSTGGDNASWSSETTWVIASGSLEKSITFDSFDDDSPVESKSTPLILKPPMMVSGPCEIKLYFSQKYYIRQIYVRSTARIYEIYQSQSQHSENEYLCTARCCIAERDDQVLQAVLKFHEESPNYTALELSENKFNIEETSVTSEDDWVDVKLLNAPLHENRAPSLSNKTNYGTEGFVQDYYEATAEISDSEPCTSVTIRLLSLQSKDYVSIDEIYVFAELVDPSHCENLAPTGCAGSSLMAMLFPTLLQLSKSGANAIRVEQASDKLGKVNKFGILSKVTDLTDVVPEIPQDEKSNVDKQSVKLQDLNRLNFVPEIPQDEKSNADQQYMKLQDPDKLVKDNRVEILPKAADLTDVLPEIPQVEKSNADQQYVKLQDVDKFTTESANTQLQSENLNGDRSLDPLVNSYSPYGRIEEVLEQLVSRVSKIEEVCLRFEENMLKPMNSMEMRIQRVEEQLESLSKNSHYSGLPPGTRTVVPSFSCNSNASSFHNDGSDGQSFSRRLELDRKEFAAGVSLNPHEGMPDLANAPRFLPSLVVTAPEFSCVEDEQNDMLEPLKGNKQDANVPSLKDSPGGKPKLCLINDVLAAALSNFLLSPSDNPSECKQTSVSNYDASQIIGDEESSQSIKILPRGALSNFLLSPSDNPSECKQTSVSDYDASQIIGDGESSQYIKILPRGTLSNFLLSPSDNPSECKQTSVSDYDASQIIGDEESSQYMKILPRGAHEVTASVSAYEEPPKYTHILTVTAPEFTSEDTGGEEDLDFLQLLCAEASTRKTDYNEASPSLFDYDLFAVTSELSHCGENKSTYDQPLIPNDLAPIILSPAKKEACSLETVVQNQFFEGSTSSRLSGRSASFSSDQEEDSTTDFNWTIEEADQGDSSILLSPVKKDVLGQISGCNNDTIKTTNVAEGPDKDVSRNVLESQTSSLDDFTSPLVDVKFTSDENSRTQSYLEALLGGLPLPEFKCEANSPRESGDDFVSWESNFIDMDGNEMIDPLTSKRLLVDLGIYDIVNSDEESGLDNRYTTSNHEMVASLI